MTIETGTCETWTMVYALRGVPQEYFSEPHKTYEAAERAGRRKKGHGNCRYWFVTTTALARDFEDYGYHD